MSPSRTAALSAALAVIAPAHVLAEVQLDLAGGAAATLTEVSTDVWTVDITAGGTVTVRSTDSTDTISWIRSNSAPGARDL